MTHDEIIQRLNLGDDLFLVGGAVRDDLLGIESNDRDYVVFNRSMAELKAAIELAGHKPKPLKTIMGSHLGYRVRGIEIVLPRKETNIGSGREMAITVDKNITMHEDALRRDFTMNALYKRVSDGVRFDPTGFGEHDVMHQMVRTTHENSFRDDPVRMLRATRFVARGYDLAAETRAQMVQHHHRIAELTQKGTSGNVFDELCKVLMGVRPDEALRIARDTGVLGVWVPEIKSMLGHEAGSRYHDLDTDEHTFKALKVAAVVGASLTVRLALLFHDSGKPDVEWVGLDGRKHYYLPSEKTWRKIVDTYEGSEFTGVPDRIRDHQDASVDRWVAFAKRVNVPRELRSDVATLIQEHMVTGKPKWKKVARLRVRLGDRLTEELLMHRMCDIAGKVSETLQQATIDIAEMERLRREMVHLQVPASVKDLKINGADAMDAGWNGPQIGEALKDVLDQVIREWSPEKNERDTQLKLLAVF